MLRDSEVYYISFISNPLNKPSIMPRRRKTGHDDGQLSIDFIVGFTIFMIAFIFVATMLSGLLVSLFSRTVDYDAVAYRTGVVLVEDPGEPRYYVGSTVNWHLLDLSIPLERDSLKRLGLSLERYSPGYLQQQKVDKFFQHDASASCSGIDALCYPDDYKSKLIFGDYPYSFNISLRKLDDPSYRKSVGEVPPPHYGYIRRLVEIKQPGASTEVKVINWTSQNVVVRMEFNELYSLANPLYRIDPLNEETTILLRNFTIPDTGLIKPIFIDVYPATGGAPTPLLVPASSPTVFIYETDSSPTPCSSLSCSMSNTSYLKVEEGFFKRIGLDEYSIIEINMTFNKTVSDGIPYKFNYNTATLPPPDIAVMEVKIW